MKNSIVNILLILIGNFFIALAIACLIVPNNILTGGVAGIAVALHPIFPNLDQTAFITFLNVALFVLGAITLGKDFIIKTTLSTVSFPIFLYAIEYFIGNQQYTDNPMLSSIYSGLFVGIGIGLAFRAGASTGGVDILAILGEKYFKIPAGGTEYLVAHFEYNGPFADGPFNVEFDDIQLTFSTTKPGE